MLTDTNSLIELANGEIQEIYDVHSPNSQTYMISYEDQELLFETNDPTSVLWANFYLAPIMVVKKVSTSIPRRAVKYRYSRVDQSVFDKLISGHVHQSQLTIHMRRVGLVLLSDKKRLVLLDPAGPMLYIIDLTHGTILAIGTNTATNRRDLARQCRELLLSADLSKGWTILHASAVVKDGAATLFIGEKGSGKTTLALLALEKGSVDYMSNDRVLVRNDHGNVVAKPYAMSVRLGGGTLKSHRTLKWHLHTYDHPEAALLPLQDQFIHQDKLELGLQEFVDILSVPLAGETSVARVVFPTMDFTGSTLHERSGREKSLEQIKDACLVPDPDGSAWLREAVGGVNVLDSDAALTLEALSQLPAVDVSGPPVGIIDVLFPEDERYTPQSWHRDVVEGRLVCVMEHRRSNRGLVMDGWKTRVVKAGDIHELMCVSEGAVQPIDRVSYLGFVEFQAGVLAVGDTVKLGRSVIGKIVGFDDTHMPNHMNIVIEQAETRTGVELGAALGDLITFWPSRELR